MPTTAQLVASALEHGNGNRYTAARLRTIAMSDSQRQAVVDALAVKERQRTAVEQRQDRRALISEERARADELRRQAVQQRQAVTADPAFGLFRQWERRIDEGTYYSAEHWHRSGRLVPVTQRTRYSHGGTVKRDVVDWTDVLDRPAQEAGLEVNELPAHFDRLRKQQAAAGRLAREAEAARRDADELARSLR